LRDRCPLGCGVEPLGTFLAAAECGIKVSSRQPAESAVLIVEDDAAIRRLVRMVLERIGYKVEIACDGLEAVLKMGLVEYDAIILDLMMPNLDGFAFINTLEENDPEVLRRIIVTSAASPAVIKERLKGQPFDMLTKPFDIHELSRAVRNCIDARQ
jgi:DNA-binding response OmpR family regulator